METPSDKISRNKPPALYAAFDVFPSRKGAAIHIEQFARALFEKMNGGLLYVIGNEDLPAYQSEGNVEIVRFGVPIENYLRRAVAFGERLAKLLDEGGDELRICHFRDVWSGAAILADENRKYKTIFEANGFPSVELPYVYRHLSPETLEKIRAQERFCLETADKIVVPSHSIERKILSGGINAEKVAVVPNGANIPPAAARPFDAPARYLIYFGAAQMWQGVDVLLRAMARLRDLPDLSLVICCSNRSRQAKALQKLTEKLELGEKVIWKFALGEAELAPWREHAVLSVAPLVECSRNVEQGCAPLKILESMAAGVPVVASDLPSVREIMSDREHGRLVQADRPGELARAIRVLLEYPALLREMGEKARAHIKENFLWENSIAQLKNIYSELLNR